MKILIDIGHPAHVHYFRNIISILEDYGHSFCVVARDKEVTLQLLDYYRISYKRRGRGRNSLLGKFLYLVFADFKILYYSLKFKPDIFISFASPYAAHVACALKKPHIALTDTEHAKLGILSYAPFSQVIITPDVFLNSFKSKHIRFKGFFELCYLHPKYFKPSPAPLAQMQLDVGSKFVLLRFVSWKASHDIGQSGMKLSTKQKVIELFANNNYRVLISSEQNLAPEFQKYQIGISPQQIHDILYYADFFIGESGTMATEAALLGTPSVYINSLDAGVFQEEVKYSLLYSFRNDENLLSTLQELIQIPDLKKKHKEKLVQLLNDKIDVTSFLSEYIHNYQRKV